MPLISCGARLPIYSLIIPAFFSKQLQPVMMWSIYIIGILLAILGAKILKKTLFAGASSPFVMELPPYRIPTLKSVIIHMNEKALMYLKKAGTLILGMSIILWALTSYPKPTIDFINAELINRGFSLNNPSDNEQIEIARKNIEIEYSAAGRLGKYILGPVLKPIGFDWKIGTALIGALAAKEVFVTQLGIVYSIGQNSSENTENLRAVLKQKYNRLTAFCLMLFCLITAPCLATIAITMKETNSIKWGLFQLFGLTVLAYIITFAVYQIGAAVKAVI